MAKKGKGGEGGPRKTGLYRSEGKNLEVLEVQGGKRQVQCRGKVG